MIWYCLDLSKQRLLYLKACFNVLSYLAAMYSHSFLPVPYFLAGNAGPGLCLQWKEIFCDGHNSIFMAWLSTQEEYLHPSNNTGEPASPITSSPPSLPDKGVLIMEKINWNKFWSTNVKLRELDVHLTVTWLSSDHHLTFPWPLPNPYLPWLGDFTWNSPNLT